MIIDAHVHLSMYQGNARSLQESKDLLLSEMVRLGVDYAIVIPDNTEASPEIAGLDTARALVGDSDPLFLLGSPNVLEGDVSEIRRYERLLEEGTIHGLKFFPGHEPYYPTDRRCVPFYAAAEEAKLPVVFHTGENAGDRECARYNDPKYIVDVAEKHPLLKVVITHYFWPKLDYCYRITNATPNIYFELAATADHEVIQASGGIDAVSEVLGRTINERPDQVIFGSDWPMGQIQGHLDLVYSLGLDQVTRGRVLGQNAVALYALDT